MGSLDKCGLSGGKIFYCLVTQRNGAEPVLIYRQDYKTKENSVLPRKASDKLLIGFTKSVKNYPLHIILIFQNISSS
jgi:hypothetical protein